MNREEDIIQWARERHIFDSATPASQHGKTLEEVQELTDALAANNEAEIKDAIGDIVVTLILQAHMHGWSLEECVEAAYQEIKDRKGRMVDGVFVKEGGVIYAIHPETKEHRLYKDAVFRPEEYEHKWEVVEADADGWIPWEGGECPLPDGSAFVYRLRSGETHDGLWATRWRHDNMSTDIVAYRPILDESSEPEAVEWDGEGLPPVGCECEFEYAETGTWIDAKVIGYDGPACVVALDGYGYAGSRHSVDFRPIRSEEERLADFLSTLPIATSPYRATAKALLKEGYRKQELE